MRWWMRVGAALVGVSLAASVGFAQDSESELRTKLREAEARAQKAEAEMRAAQAQARVAAEAARRAADQAMRAAQAAGEQAKRAEQAARAQAESAVRESGRRGLAQREAAEAARARAEKAVAAARKSAAEKLDKAKVEKKEPFIGLVTEKVGDALAAQFSSALGGGGLVIAQVMPKSPADKAGLKTHDVIVAFNGGAVKSPEELKTMVLKHKAGDKVSIVVLRAAQKTPVEVELGEHASGSIRAHVLTPGEMKEFHGALGDELKVLGKLHELKDLEKLKDLKGMKIELKELGDLKDLQEKIRVEVDGQIKDLSKLKELQGLKLDDLKGKLELEIKEKLDHDLKGKMKDLEKVKEDLHKKIQMRVKVDGKDLTAGGNPKATKNRSISINNNNGRITIRVETTDESGKRETHNLSGTREEIKAKLSSLPESVRESISKAIEGLDSAGGASIKGSGGGARIVTRRLPQAAGEKKVDVRGGGRIILMDKNGEVKHFDLDLNEGDVMSKVQDALKDLPKEVRIQVEKSLKDAPKIETRVKVERDQ